MSEEIKVIALKEFEGGPDPEWFYCRGHVDKAEFMGEMARQHDRLVLLDDIRHTYYRHVPSPPLKGYLTECQPGHGAFPVTVVDADCATIGPAKSGEVSR